MKKSKFILLLPILLFGCSSSENIYLSCNGFSETLKVYGNQIETIKEPLVIPIKIKRLDGYIERIFNPPVYEIQIGYTIFENQNLFVDKTQYVGTNKRVTDSNKNQYESRFNINRDTNHLIFYDFSFSPKTQINEKTQKTIDFEGKCEKVNDKV